MPNPFTKETMDERNKKRRENYSLMQSQELELKKHLENFYCVHNGMTPELDVFLTNSAAEEFAEDIILGLYDEVSDDVDNFYDEDGDPMTDEEDEWERTNPYD